MHAEDYDFLLFYRDGDVYDESVFSAAPRAKTVACVRKWLERGSDKVEHKSTYQYRNGSFVWAHTNDRKSLAIRGSVDRFGRIATVWWDRKTKLESLRICTPLGAPGERLPVYVNVATHEELAELAVGALAFA